MKREMLFSYKNSFLRFLIFVLFLLVVLVPKIFDKKSICFIIRTRNLLGIAIQTKKVLEIKPYIEVSTQKKNM